VGIGNNITREKKWAFDLLRDMFKFLPQSEHLKHFDAGSNFTYAFRKVCFYIIKNGRILNVTEENTLHVQ
jgi:hypothetical protein